MKGRDDPSPENLPFSPAPMPIQQRGDGRLFREKGREGQGAKWRGTPGRGSRTERDGPGRVGCSEAQKRDGGDHLGVVGLRGRTWQRNGGEGGCVSLL
jgi:hypothetical protein